MIGWPEFVRRPSVLHGQWRWWIFPRSVPLQQSFDRQVSSTRFTAFQKLMTHWCFRCNHHAQSWFNSTNHRRNFRVFRFRWTQPRAGGSAIRPSYWSHVHAAILVSGISIESLGLYGNQSHSRGHQSYEISWHSTRKHLVLFVWNLNQVEAVS